MGALYIERHRDEHILFENEHNAIINYFWRFIITVVSKNYIYFRSIYFDKF